MVNMKPTLAVNAPLEAIQYPVYGSSKFDGIRCVQMQDICRHTPPPVYASGEHTAACHFATLPIGSAA